MGCAHTRNARARIDPDPDIGLAAVERAADLWAGHRLAGRVHAHPRPQAHHIYRENPGRPAHTDTGHEREFEISLGGEREKEPPANTDVGAPIPKAS